MSEENLGGAGPALGGAGSPCPSITFMGTTWKVGWPTQDAKLWYEFLVAEHAEDELKALQRFLPPREFAAKWARLENDVRAGQHRVGGALWEATMRAPDGMPLFLLSLLKEHHPGADLAAARVLYYSAAPDVRMALAKVVPPFAAVLVADAPVPQDEKATRARDLAAALLEMAGVPAPETPTPSDGPSG